MKTKTCNVKECNNIFYAKGFCKNHYMMNRRYGRVIYKKDMPKPKCLVEGCEKPVLAKELCKLHYYRKSKGIDLHRPKGNKGSLNPRWNGGTSEYPNHYKMKKERLKVLKEAKYICHYCGKPANQVHHKDLSKDNHTKDNLVACCCKCNSKRRKPYTSKYKRLYGKTLQELANILNTSITTVLNMHKRGKLFVYLHNEIQAVLW